MSCKANEQILKKGGKKAQNTSFTLLDIKNKMHIFKNAGEHAGF